MRFNVHWLIQWPYARILNYEYYNNHIGGYNLIAYMVEPMDKYKNCKVFKWKRTGCKLIPS